MHYLLSSPYSPCPPRLAPPHTSPSCSHPPHLRGSPHLAHFTQDSPHLPHPLKRALSLVPRSRDAASSQSCLAHLAHQTGPAPHIQLAYVSPPLHQEPPSEIILPEAALSALTEAEVRSHAATRSLIPRSHDPMMRRSQLSQRPRCDPTPPHHPLSHDPMIP